LHTRHAAALHISLFYAYAAGKIKGFTAGFNKSAAKKSHCWIHAYHAFG